MSRDPQATALRHAARQGVPYVHRDGCMVVLVAHLEANHIAGKLRGQTASWMCASAGLAQVVEARVLLDAQNFPEHAGNILAVSVLYAEAALRHAHRRARRTP